MRAWGRRLQCSSSPFLTALNLAHIENMLAPRALPAGQSSKVPAGAWTSDEPESEIQGQMPGRAGAEQMPGAAHHFALLMSAPGSPYSDRSGHYHSGLRPEPPASASGDCFITSGLRPKPPASASGDPFAPRRTCRGPPCGPWGQLRIRTSSPFLNCDVPAFSAGSLPAIGATRGDIIG